MLHLLIAMGFVSEAYTGYLTEPSAVQILDNDKYHFLLNLVHQRLTTARNGHHLMQQLASLTAFVRLAEHNVEHPATFRYIVHILLPCLQFRYRHALSSAALLMRG